MSRIWNFSAGPATLPVEVLEQVQSELLDWQGAGCGVMEMSHRGKEFTKIRNQAEADLRLLMGIPDNYRVLFLQGGATLQFAQIPLNLLSPTGRANYIVTGSWSKKAFKEAQHISTEATVTCSVSTEDKNLVADGFTRAPDYSALDCQDNDAYVHLCTNETIHGVELPDPQLPMTGRVPIVADMSSHILSRPLDVSRYGLIYAGAQKNIGPSGLTVVIVRDDLIGRAPRDCPSLLDYKVMADNDSMLNTPPTFAIYVAGLVFQWLLRQGGLTAIECHNQFKADALYRCIDESHGFYRNPVMPEVRSRMNVPFTLADSSLDGAFLSEAAQHGLLGLKGHKSVGGMRASIYNAMPAQGVHVLVDFMADFQRRHSEKSA